MKIVVAGSVYLDIRIKLDGKYNAYGNNSGFATTQYSSPAFELAKQLALDGNEVIFVSSIDSPASVYIRRMLEEAGVSSVYIAYEPNGFGFRVSFDGVTSGQLSNQVCGKLISKTIQENESTILDNVDAVIVDHVSSKIKSLCSKRNVKLYWLADDSDIKRFDSSDAVMKSFTNVPTISLDNYKEVLA